MGSKKNKKRRRNTIDENEFKKQGDQGEDDSLPIKDTQPHDDDKFKENYQGNQCQYERV